MASIPSTDPTNQEIETTTRKFRTLSFSSVCSDLSDGSKDVIINDRWRVVGKIGQGSFGEVFEVRDIYSGEAYAIKRENKAMRHPQLLNEYTYYNILKGGPGVPNCYWYGEYEDFNCLVLDLLGPSLKELRQCVRGFPLDIIIDLGCQMVDILHHVHDKGLVFRDMKPDNFLLSSSCHLPEVQMVKMDADLPHYKYQVPACRSVFQQWGESRPKLYIVDFGLTTYWRDPETGQSFPEGKRKTRNKIGTARYASLNVHHGRMHTRRDDLEGLAYMILDMVLGTLPWSGIQARNSKAGWDRMRGMKKDIFMSDLCAGRPIGIVEFAEYTKQLRYAEEPDYELLKKYLRGSLPGGEFSKLAISPFGGGTTPKDTIGDFKQKAPGSSPAMQDGGGSGGSSSSSSSEKIKWKDRNKETKVGWNTYKHDLEPWNPEIDWDRNSTNQTALSWGDTQPNASWGPSPTEQGTSTTVHNPAIQPNNGWGQYEPEPAPVVGSTIETSWTNDTVNRNTTTTAAATTDQTGRWTQPQKETNNTTSTWVKNADNAGTWSAQQQNGWGSKPSPVSTSWQSMPRETQQPHGANQQWQTVGQNRQQQQQDKRAYTSRRGKSQGPQRREDLSKPRKPKNDEPWNPKDFGGGWVTNAGGDGWVVKDNRNGPAQRAGRDP